MARPNKYTAEQIITALQEAQGMKTVAARRLGCSLNTINRYVREYTTVQDALDEVKADTADRIELTLLSLALGQRAQPDPNNPNAPVSWIVPPNLTALIFLAKTSPIMRERGYYEQKAITGEEGGAVEVVVRYAEEEAGEDESETE